MSDGYDISLDLKAPTGGLDSYLKKMRAIEVQQKKLNKLAGQGMTSGTTPTTDPTQKILKQLEKTQRVRAIPGPKFTQGPAQRLQAALRNQANAQAMGNPAQQFDAGLATQRAQTAYEKALKAASPQTSDQTAKALKTALTSNRSGGKSGLFGLGEIGEVAEALGSVATVAGTVVAAFKLVQSVADSAAQGMGSFITAQTTSGGTAEQTAKLQAMGGAAGLSPEQVGAQAKTFAQNMATNPFMQSLLQGQGITPDFDPEGHFNTNKATNYLKALNFFLNKATPEQAQKMINANPPGASNPFQSYAEDRYLSAKQRQQILAQAEQDAKVYGDPQNRAAAAAYNAAKSNVGIAASQMFGSIAQHILTPTLNATAKVLRGNSTIVPMGQGPEMAKRRHAAEMATKAAAGGGASNKHASALDANTQAINRNTVAMQYVPTQMRQIFGGGDRASGAVPARWRFHVLQQVMDHHLARTLGAFSQ